MGAVRRIGVLTSGGDAPGMNAAVRAVVRMGAYAGIEAVGVRRGFDGLLRRDFVPLDRRAVADLIHRGGTILGTARCDRMRTDEGQAQAAHAIAQAALDGLVVIGGDGSLHGAIALEGLGVPTVGVPGTIDNDLNGTESSIGFDTACNTALEAIDRVRDTATAHDRTFVVEVMGRECGHLALACAIAGGAECVLVPEVPTRLEVVCERVQEAYTVGKRHSIVVVAEGAARGFDVASEIGARTGLEARVTVLGHVQRGGTPTAPDRLLASYLGAAAVTVLAEGGRGVMVGWQAGRVVRTGYAEVLAAPKALDMERFALVSQLAI